MICSKHTRLTSKHSTICLIPRYVTAVNVITVPELTNLKEPKLWYGIGILYDRYGSLEHAEEAFSQVMRMEPNFEKANEIYFRLGIIYKQQQKFNQSLDVSGLQQLAQRSLLTCFTVLQVHCYQPTPPVDRRRHMVSDWPCV